MHFSEIFMKTVTCDNGRCHRKEWLHPLSRKYILQKYRGIA